MKYWIVALSLFAALAARADVPGASGYWSLNGHSADSIGGRNGVTNGTMTYTRNGVVGKSGTFNGSARIGIAAPVINTSAYTKSAWIRLTNTTASHNILSSFTNGQHAFWAPNQYTNRLSSGHNGTWNYVQDNVAVPTGVWQHVVVTYDRGLSNGTMKLYRNGVPVGGKPSATNVPLPNGAADLQIGGHGTGNNLAGDIDDCTIWPRAISDAEVLELYTNGLRRIGALRMTNNILARVPEAEGFQTVYEYDLPLASNLGTTGLPDYQADFTTNFSGRKSFDRVAYYLELQPTNAGAAMQWVYVSMDPFTRRVTQIGVPAVAAGGIFQQIVTSMNVFADGLVTPGTNLQTGNIEFWGWNYTTNNALPVPNASSAVYDFGDQMLAGGGTHGSMQVHNHDVDGAGPGTTGQTLFAYNQWGTSGNDELGIGTSPTGNPDWTFRQNTPGYSLRSLIVLVRPALLPDVELTAWPRDLQVTPRNPATGRGTVQIAGLVRTSSVDQVTLDVTRNGAAWTQLVQSVTVTGTPVPFGWGVEIPAEFASYAFSLTVRENGTNVPFVQTADVVAGDVYLVNGQSNAEAVQYSGSANGYQSPWVRSFGSRIDNAISTSNDLTWRIAEGNLGQSAAAVGQWALRMGRALADTNGVPVALINGARGGQPINYFRRTDTLHEDLNNNYGRLLYRVRQAGVVSNALAMLWYQGESDVGMADIHERGFARLLDNWREDFPGLDRFYVFQIREGCGTIANRGDMPLRERQRLMQDRYAGVTVLTTSGFDAHNGCHYNFTNGYEAIGLYAARILARDLHGFAQPQIDAPNPAHAWLGAGGTEVTIATRQTGDQLQWLAVGGAGPEADFVIDGAAVTVTNGYATNNTIVLQLSGSAAGATGVSYIGHAGVVTNGWVVNGAGVGLLTFGGLPVAADTNPPVAVSGAAAHPIASNRIDLAWPVATGAGWYRIERDGAVIGTAWETIFVDGALTNAGVHAYRIAAASPFGTSAWSAVFSATNAVVQATVPVTELADYELLYLLEASDDLVLVSTLKAPYQIDRSAGWTQAFDRVAYVMESQVRPGEALRWVTASFQPPTNTAAHLGVPSIATGAIFEQYVTDLVVRASSDVPATPVLHSGSGFIEFWGYNYSAPTNSSIPGASTTAYDADDTRATSGNFGSMQVHNVNADGAGRIETVLAFNQWGQSGVDDWGLGTSPTNNPDWTFASTATNYGLRRLAVLVRTDADGDGLPDVWEQSRFGTTTNEPAGDADGDGVSNADEFAADTNPTNSGSFPRVVIGRAGPSTAVQFDTSAARVYQLEFSTNLAVEAWTPFAPEQDGTGGAVSLIETNGVDVVREYRLKIRVP